MHFFKTYLSFFCLVIAIAAGCKKDDKAPPPPTAPVVATAGLTNITTSGATAGGSIVSDGGATITASGIVWSQTNAMPTLADSVMAGTTATGTFTSNISGLDFNTAYYIRAFATNSVGTGYGDVVTLNTTNDTNKVKFTYNDEEVVYGIIVSATTGKKWLDRNLGAKQVATSSDDYEAYGDLFQWGRPDDGHQLINWTNATTGTPVNGITTTLATSDIPGHSDFILAPIDGSSHADWRNDNNMNRWITAPQGPCPAGWHVPSIDEWAAEVYYQYDYNGSPQPTGGTATSGGIIDAPTAYNLLKLTVAGYRSGDDDGEGGILRHAGMRGVYWSTSEESFSGWTQIFGLTFGDAPPQLKTSGAMAVASSIRCIKD